MSDLPVACTLDPAALESRRQGLLADLVRQAADCEQLPDGYRFRFVAAGGTLALIARMIDAERECCRFLRFRVTVEPGGGPIFLELTGPGGTRDFLAALIDP